MTLENPRNKTLIGLRRMLGDADTAVQLVSFTQRHGDRMITTDRFGTMRVGVDYWPRRPSASTDDIDMIVQFVNTTTVVGLMWASSWTYWWEDGTKQAVIARRQSRDGGPILTLRIHQPLLLAAQWSESLTPDRIESE